MPRPFILGRERFERISAVEGVQLSPEALARRSALDAQGASLEERRRAIIYHHTKQNPDELAE